MKRVSTMEDGGYAWMALNVPLASRPMATAVAVSVVVKGCVLSLSISSFAVLK